MSGLSFPEPGKHPVTRFWTKRIRRFMSQKKKRERNLFIGHSIRQTASVVLETGKDGISAISWYSVFFICYWKWSRNRLVIFRCGKKNRCSIFPYTFLNVYVIILGSLEGLDGQWKWLVFVKYRKVSIYQCSKYLNIKILWINSLYKGWTRGMLNLCKFCTSMNS